MIEIYRMVGALNANRIKQNVDYALVHKYGRTRVMCDVVWQPSIQETADKFGVKIDEWFTY